MSNKFQYCYHCKDEHLESEFASAESYYCRASLKAKLAGVEVVVETGGTYSVREKKDSGHVLHNPPEYIKMRERANDDFFRNRVLRNKTDEEVMKSVKAAIADAVGRRLARREIVPVVSWEQLQQKRVYLKTY